MQKSKGFTVIEVIAVIIIVGLLVFVGFMAFNNRDNNNDTNGSQDTETVETDPYEGWQTYNSTTADVSLRYPESWVVEQLPTLAMIGEPTESIQFTSPATEEGNALRFNWNLGQNVTGQQVVVRDVTDLDTEGNYLMLYNTNTALQGVGNFGFINEGVEVDTTIDYNTVTFDLGDEQVVNFSLEGGMLQGEEMAAEMTVDDFKNHPNWEELVKIFNSLQVN